MKSGIKRYEALIALVVIVAAYGIGGNMDIEDSQLSAEYQQLHIEEGK